MIGVWWPRKGRLTADRDSAWLKIILMISERYRERPGMAGNKSLLHIPEAHTHTYTLTILYSINEMRRPKAPYLNHIMLFILLAGKRFGSPDKWQTQMSCHTITLKEHVHGTAGIKELRGEWGYTMGWLAYSVDKWWDTTIRAGVSGGGC